MTSVVAFSDALPRMFEHTRRCTLQKPKGSHRALDGLAHSSAIFALVWVFTPQA